MLSEKNVKICKDEELQKAILLALNASPLNSDFDRVRDCTDGSIKDLEVSSAYRKLKFAIKSGREYAIVYLSTSEDEEEKWASKLRVGNWSTVSWLKKSGKYKESKQVTIYESEVIEYKEKINSTNLADSLNFMVIPSHIWNNLKK